MSTLPVSTPPISTRPDGAGANLGAFMVGYTLDYAHRVVVGVRAASAEAACAIVRTAFDAGTLWDDTPDMPLLYDDYEELDGQVLDFDATAVPAWAAAHASVRQVRLHAAAERLLAFARLVDNRALSASVIGSWHPDVLVGLSLTAGQLRELRTLLATLADR
ncbi:hypothetical protein [Paraburkholderia sp. BL21I4N1]|uniref:hypothetical protein n=1 Tax=Paraburkholderia sp. BL21I4N1 TaxID=1938801 RepID=UPI000D473468|nr:hypothetical protein [Paraburkholderia sp. BL21I4N1]PQV44120.1 hypothetical protein B0G83_12718 [Paraburkholderia sp. BL21I4N1]